MKKITGKLSKENHLNQLFALLLKIEFIDLYEYAFVYKNFNLTEEKTVKYASALKTLFDIDNQITDISIKKQNIN